VGSLAVEAIAARLDDRFRLLTGGARDALPRQRTLRAALDWSYDLLGPPEQRLLDRLSVFSGGWTLAAAEVVCAGGDVEDWELVDLLDGLVNKSLVQAQEAGTELRYGMLETVRQYGHELLAQAGAAAGVRERHLAWYLALAEDAEPRLRGPDQGAWLGRLEAEHDNLRAALGWAREQEAGEAALRLSGALERFWQVRGYLREGCGWLEMALAAGSGAPPGLRAKAVRGVGTFAAMQGDFEHATAHYEEALALHRELDDKGGIAQGLGDLANVAYWRTEYQRAEALCEEVLALYRELGDKLGIAGALTALGWCVVFHEPGRVRRLAEEALALYRELGDKWGSCEALFLLGYEAYHQGDYVRSAARHEEGLAVRRDVGDMAGITASLLGLTLVAYKQRDHRRAATLVHESMLLSRDIGFKQVLANGMEVTAWLAMARGQPRPAALVGGAAEAVGEAIGAPLQPDFRAEHDLAVAAMHTALGEQPFAAAWAEGRALSQDEAVALALETTSEAATALQRSP
jgi:non-specific serine/threonine protein kinase